MKGINRKLVSINHIIPTIYLDSLDKSGGLDLCWQLQYLYLHMY